ncbi:MAG TPA: hypothetical protein VMW56_28175 [Candidatus Margulisiibacteriota bacterium]|nr:hypothetical protein [Candidatus Margulisiibacteriota bacterium]
MSGSNQQPCRRVLGVIGAVCLVLIAAGCGSDATVDTSLTRKTPTIVGAVTGTVFAPNGEFAASDAGWRWACNFGLLSPAYAQTCLATLMPAGGILNVVLWQIDRVDAKDGQIDNPRIVNQARTDGDGIYQIIDHAADDLDTCRLMVVVGRDESLTRAFAIEHTTNIDAVSEAVVRVVLDRITQSPPVELCAFTNDGLANILDQARAAACSAKGSTVAEINDSAYQHVKVNCGVLQAINDATGVPLPLPARCS